MMNQGVPGSASAKRKKVPMLTKKSANPAHASAPIGPITPVAQAGDVAKAEIFVQVNGADRQRSNVSQLIWNIGETIEHLSAAWELQPGGLVYSGTPEGVAAVVAGDTLLGGVAGLESIRLVVR